MPAGRLFLSAQFVICYINCFKVQLNEPLLRPAISQTERILRVIVGQLTSLGVCRPAKPVRAIWGLVPVLTGLHLDQRDAGHQYRNKVMPKAHSRRDVIGPLTKTPPRCSALYCQP